LHHGDNAIVYDADVFAGDIFINLRYFFFFESADTLRFDKNLVGYGLRAKYAPCRAVVVGFFDEKPFTGVYYRVVLYRCIAQSIVMCGFVAAVNL